VAFICVYTAKQRPDSSGVCKKGDGLLYKKLAAFHADIDEVFNFISNKSGNGKSLGLNHVKDILEKAGDSVDFGEKFHDIATGIGNKRLAVHYVIYLVADISRFIFIFMCLFNIKIKTLTACIRQNAGVYRFGKALLTQLESIEILIKQQFNLSFLLKNKVKHKTYLSGVK
jgi:hypothetical protein